MEKIDTDLKSLAKLFKPFNRNWAPWKSRGPAADHVTDICVRHQGSASPRICLTSTQLKSEAIAQLRVWKK